MDCQRASSGCKWPVLAQTNLGKYCECTGSNDALGAAEGAPIECMMEMLSKQRDYCEIAHPLLCNSLQHFAFRIGTALAKDAGISPVHIWQRHYVRQMMGL